MTSPVVIAAYSFAALWLVFKYRMLLRGRPRAIAGAELLPAVLVTASVAIVPSVEIDGKAWCSEVTIGPVAMVVLLVAVAGPLFDPARVSPMVAVTATLLTATYLARNECYGVSFVVAGAAIVAAMTRIASSASAS